MKGKSGCEKAAKIFENAITTYRSVAHQACRFNGEFDRTYFAWITAGGQQYIASYDHEAKLILKTLLGAVGNDDHAMPSLLIRSDGHILAFLPQGLGHADAICLRTSTNPEDIGSFGEPVVVKTSHSAYPRAWETLDGKIGVITRYRNRVEEISFSKDGGEKWGAPKTLINYGGGAIPYGVVFSELEDPGVLHYAGFYVDRSTCYRFGVFYMRSLDGGETWQRINGSLIELPADQSSMDLVWKAQLVRVLDVAADFGKPYILAAHPIDVSGSNTIYRIHYEGGGWIREAITDSTTFFFARAKVNTYTTGAVFDCRNPNRVFVSARSGDYSDMQIWERVNGVWTKMADLTCDAKDHKIRPQSPRNRHPNFQAFWASGTYIGYGNWRCNLWKYPSTNES